ncbi:MAG: hypothetical protein ACREVI_04355 [Steroidobacteraceae bacterium]
MGNSPTPIDLLRHYRAVLVTTANFAGRSARAMVRAGLASNGGNWVAGTVATGWRSAAIEAARRPQLPTFAKWFTTSGV